MTSPILRMLGAVAGLGSAILFWFVGGALAGPLRYGRPSSLPMSQYALLAFLSIPALVLAILALFWVPPRVSNAGPSPDGRRWRVLLVVLFVAAFLLGLLLR